MDRDRGDVALRGGPRIEPKRVLPAISSRTTTGSGTLASPKSSTQRRIANSRKSFRCASRKTGLVSHATMEAIVMTTASSAVVPDPVVITPELLAQHSITPEEYER